MYALWIKRPLDFCLAALAFIVLSPVIIITAFFVKAKLGSPVIFKQLRPGKDEKIFAMYKFRTMTNERDGKGDLLPDDRRLTKFGKFLRSTSLDELPELFNILKGDMSVVGPRPLLPEYLSHYNKHQRQRHNVRPGITGLAQVKGRNALSWEETFNFDIQYVNNISFIGDIKIILATAGKVLTRQGISAQGIVGRESFVKPVIIIGAGGHGKVICDIITKSGEKVLGFLDDSITDNVLGYPILGATDKAFGYKDKARFIVGIGNNQTRKELAERFGGLNWHTAIHPAAVIGLGVIIGKGTAIMANAVINPGTTIGDHCIINTAAVIEHDNSIGGYVHISPNAATGGGVTIGDICHIGIGSSVKEGISICDNCTIGAGAVLTKDAKRGGIYIGIPAVLK